MQSLRSGQRRLPLQRLLDWLLQTLKRKGCPSMHQAEETSNLASTPPENGLETSPIKDLAAQVQSLSQLMHETREYDVVRERVVESLSRDLREAQGALLLKLSQPLLLGLTRMHDQLSRQLEDLDADEPLPGTDAIRLVENWRDDIEILLENQGISRFRTVGNAFDSSTQTALDVVLVADPSLHRTVAERGRPGFREDDRVLQKERVVVYSSTTQHSPSSDQEHTPSEPKKGTDHV